MNANYPGFQPFNLGVESRSPGRVRLGKTYRDRASGAFAQNRANVHARGDWSRDGGEFPSGTCNGKRTQALRNRPSKKRSK